ncbi:MAG: tetratricopeptide repeat protein [Planctomycetota bacterium]|nr:tetratricopeptide repeat protein [Planctomycetota bacterium]
MRSITGLGAALALFASISVAGTGPWIDFQKGVAAFKRNDLKTAHELFERVVRTDDTIKDAHYYLGMIADRRRDTRKAAHHFAQVSEKSRSYAFAQAKLGSYARRQGDLESAAKHYEKAVTLRPSVDLWLNLANVQIVAKKHEEAEKALKSGEKMSPRDLDIADAFARLYLSMREFEKAYARYEQVANRIPNDMSAHFGKAVCLMKLDKDAAAESVCNHILRKDPNHKGVLGLLIRMYEGDPGKEDLRARYEKRLEWVKKNPPRRKPRPRPTSIRKR